MKPQHRVNEISRRSTKQSNFPGSRTMAGPARLTIFLRPDGQLDLAAVGLHAFECPGQIGQANFFGDEVGGGNVAAADSFESVANKSRGVVERRNQLDFRIVNGGGLDFHLGAAGQATEEINYTAA